MIRMKASTPVDGLGSGSLLSTSPRVASILQRLGGSLPVHGSDLEGGLSTTTRGLGIALKMIGLFNLIQNVAAAKVYSMMVSGLSVILTSKSMRWRFILSTSGVGQRVFRVKIFGSMRSGKGLSLRSTCQWGYGWLGGWVNAFLARRSVLRSDAGTLFSRSENTSDFYSEFVVRGAWSFDWNDTVSNFCALEWLVAERPTEGFLDAPMGDCGLRLRGDSYQGHVSLGYTLRRPTWVEWFGDGVDLLGNPDLNPEWGLGTALDFTWYPSAEWTWALDARVRRGEEWISWVPSSFSTRKAENLGQFRQAIGGLSVGWRPNPIVRVSSMARISWTREKKSRAHGSDFRRMYH